MAECDLLLLLYSRYFIGLKPLNVLNSPVKDLHYSLELRVDSTKVQTDRVVRVQGHWVT